MKTTAKTKPASIPKAELPAGLDPLAAIVLSALPSAPSEARDSLSAGEHPVDLTLTVRVKGELRVAPDSTARQVNKLKPWTLCRLLANRLPQAVLEECIDRALAVAKAPEGSAEAAAAALEEDAGDELKARVEAAFDQAGLAVIQPRRGSVRLHGNVEIEVDE